MPPSVSSADATRGHSSSIRKGRRHAQEVVDVRTRWGPGPSWGWGLDCDRREQHLFARDVGPDRNTDQVEGYRCREARFRTRRRVPLHQLADRQGGWLEGRNASWAVHGADRALADVRGG